MVCITEALGISREHAKLIDCHIEEVLSSEHTVSGVVMAFVDPLCKEDFTEIERLYMAFVAGVNVGEEKVIRSMKSALSTIEEGL